MITYLKGDATNPRGEGKKIIIHCVNNIGRMGAGFAKALYTKYPIVKEHYLSAKLYPLGGIQTIKITEDLSVINIIGQNGVRSAKNPTPVKYDALKIGLQSVNDIAKLEGATVHSPRIACGLAGGTWAEVSKIVEEVFTDTDVYVYNLEK